MLQRTNHEKTVSRWQPAFRANLPLRNKEGVIIDRAAWDEDNVKETKGLWARPISAWASGQLPRYRLGDEAVQELRRAVPSDEWIKDLFKDARELVIGCAIHVCSPSCYKYHSRGASHICRHNFYHVVTLTDLDGVEVRRRRRGKALRGCVAIFRDTRYGMAGRVITFQVHPGECPTNYAGLVALRCNLDVQDMRRVLPPHLWLQPDHQEPAAAEDAGETHTHGLYPQRLPAFSLGPQEDWGWLRLLATTEHYAYTVLSGENWSEVFKNVLGSEPGANESAPRIPASQDDVDAAGSGDGLASDVMDQERDRFFAAASSASSAMFVDAHNTGYYVNSYTTKLNPTMDSVLRNLLDGVRRLQQEWRSTDDGEPTMDAASRGKQGFRRTMQVLGRFETCFRRASWKSGSEMVFPILFGHLAFTTHRCWTVFMRKAIYLAAESWRRAYGQVAVQQQSDKVSALQYKLPNGDDVIFVGWSEERRGEHVVFISPEGVEFNSLTDAAEHLTHDASIGAAKWDTACPALRAMSRLVDDLKVGHAYESEAAVTDKGVTQLPAAEQNAKGYAFSQLDDWLNRGEHPIVKDMNLYVYSIWVYRVELSPFSTANASEHTSSKPRFVDIPFDESYPARTTWVQRLASEPRVPRVEGMQFVGEADREMHFMSKAVLLRPVYLALAGDEQETRHLRILRSYQQLCVPPAGEDAWPALGGGPNAPGPFERGWHAFLLSQTELAASARRKCGLMNASSDLWRTQEVQRELDALAAIHEDGALCGRGRDLDMLLHVDEYCALETLQTADNFDGIARARTTKPQRQVEKDQQVVEQPLREEGSGEGGIADAQVEGAAERALVGMGVLGDNAHIAHRFDPDTLEKIVSYEVAERTQAFVRDLKDLPFMAAGGLPQPQQEAELEARQGAFRSELLEPFEGLSRLGRSALREVVDIQRRSLGRKDVNDGDAHRSEDVPPDPEDAAPHGRSPSSVPTPIAKFAPCDQWRRPSDYVAHLASRFEDGTRCKKTGKFERRPLKRDQVLFLTQFADALNTVWDDEQNDKPVQHRKRFSMLLLGQGGSGKTAIVQEIVLPAMDFIFPQEPGQVPSSLIVCAKWSQAENISTPDHKAVSCHRAALLGIQSYRNAAMPAGAKKSALQRMWNSRRLLVLEEISMVSATLYNMLLFRSFLGRAETWEVQEVDYGHLAGAFGRMPIVIHLGDFLQLTPTAGISLLADLRAMEASDMRDVPAEFQEAMNLFCRTPFCFELLASNRFKEPKLRELMAFIRDPAETLPADIEASWLRIQLTPEDTRLQAQRFQTGHMIGIYWDTVARWMMMRAKRDAQALGTPLFLVQAADVSSPPMDRAFAAKLMNQPNPKDTGHMHGMLPVHVGMSVRLLEALDLEKGVVKDTEGEVVHVTVNPLDQADVDEAIASGRPSVYLRHVPLGIWVRFAKYARAPFTAKMAELDSSLTPASTESLIFIEPYSASFKWRGHAVTRTGFPFSHGRVITSTACQGRTLRAGVLIDCGRRTGGANPKSDNDWWLDLYVMLSRATRLEDLLLVRAPPCEFFLQGPPSDLRQQLAKLSKRTDECRVRAAKLAEELGFEKFFH